MDKDKQLSESLRVVTAAINKAQKNGVFELEESYVIKLALDLVTKTLQPKSPDTQSTT